MDPVVILAHDTVAAAPGNEARLQVRVRNQGRRVESYTIEVVGEPARFVQVEPRSVSVLPGKEAEITITFRPPVGATTPTGSLPFAVRAVSEVGSSSSAVAEGRLELSGAAGLQAWADATTDAGRWSGAYRLSFSNQGNAPARLFISANDPSGSVHVAVRDEILAVAAGAQVDTEIKVKARQPFLKGTTVNRIITASCQDFPFGAERPAPGQAPPRDDPNHRTFQLTFQQKPVVSKLVLALAALAIAGVVAFGFFRLRSSEDVVLGLARPDAPSTLTAAPAGSTEIVLEWSRVPNAAGYEIRETTTDTGQPSGPPVETVDAETQTFIVKGLLPGEPHCYAVKAVGPEGVDGSVLSAPACATTAPTPTLAAPTNFTATEVSPGRFDVTWDAPAVEGVTFAIFAKNDPLNEGIEGNFTTIQLEQQELSEIVPLKVRAVSGDQRSDFSNVVEVTVAARPVDATTVPTTTTAGASAPTTLPGGNGGPTTTAAGGATTTTSAATTTTTAPPTPAQGAIRDLDATWVAMIGPVQPVLVGTSETAQRARLAQDFAVAPEAIVTFTNRDTVATDAAGAPIPEFAARAPSDRFFYVPQPNEPAAVGFCRDDLRCRPMILVGAPNAAEGTNVVVLRGVAASTPLADLDELLATTRTETARPKIHVLDGSVRDQFDVDQLLVFASGFVDEPAVLEFCRTNEIEPCVPTVLEPAP